MASGRPLTVLAQSAGPPAAKPVGRWILSKSASGIRASDAGIELLRGTGWVFTSAVFADFSLDLEFRLVESGTRASVYVRAWPGERPSYGSYSVNLSDAVSGSAPLAGITSGNRQLAPDATQTVARRAALENLGAWQKLTIVCNGKSMRVTLNGTLVDQLGDVLAVEGVLGLAADAGRVELRSIEVREFDPPPLPDLRADPERGIYDPSMDRFVVGPRVKREVHARYTPGAMLRRIQGMVTMKALVLTDGTIGDVRVTKGLDREQDRAAVEALRQWLFTPATREGTPVKALVEVEMAFSQQK